MYSISNSGGAIYSSTQNSMMILQGNDFTRNRAGYGGGVYVGADHINITLAKNTFVSNHAINGGMKKYKMCVNVCTLGKRDNKF